MIEKLHDRLAYPPRGMRADRAAAYLSISRSKFLELVKDGRMPKPKYVDKVAVWDRLAVELAFEAIALEDEDGGNSFDRLMKERGK